MNKSEWLAIALVILASAGTVAGILAFEHHRRAQLYTVELIARAPEHGNWYPRSITVLQGQPVRILVRNIETVSHGFALPEFNVAIREIKAGHVETVSFTPDKRGHFPWLCTVWCSDRHPEMTGTLIVQ
ncbi:MAG: cupredoxin domain-containing protein [Lentisphaerae bacterium]|nr:cupredoxin domain-containing protein [Lentisphaerota bacterium]